MKNRMWLGVLFVITLALAGCADQRMIREDKDDLATASLVFGYVDMGDAPVNLDWFGIKQVVPKTDKPYWYAAVDEGMFWGSHFKPGAYQMDSFGGFSRWRNANFTFELPQQYADKFRFKTDGKPGIYFLGSYKYKDVKTGFFEPGKFDFVAVKSPTERELLERLLKFTDSKIWEARIRKRLQELPQ